jgi:hypothetical protein
MSAQYRINDTSLYHRCGMKTLGWELTVCNAMEDDSSPCRGVINKNSSFGGHLIDLLRSVIPLGTVSRVIEIGGGYGYIMRDFVHQLGIARAAMLDLSPVIIDKQKKTLEGLNVEFYQQDFFDAGPDFFRNFDLALLNEVAGDFPTVCDINPDFFSLPDDSLDPVLARVKKIFSFYGLPLPPEPFNFNLGAIDAVEKLCSSGIRHIYLSEHSCECPVPEDMKNKIQVTGPGNPERIPLMGHDEYTIKFSHLERMADRLGYRAERGQYRDFISFDYTARLNFILTSNSQKDEHEMIRQFIEDLYKYEYLILTRVNSV